MVNRTALFTAATTGTSPSAEMAGMVWLKLFLKGHGTVSAGTIVVEEADYFGTIPPTPPATWSPLATITCTDVSDGTQKSYTLAITAYSAVRARFTADVTGGGSVDLELIGVGP